LDKLVIFGFLILATTVEASGDAIVRMGLNEQALVPRLLLFVIGAGLLFVYGLSLNLAPLEFGRSWIAYPTLFVVWQIISFIAFRAVPTVPMLVGGALSSPAAVSSRRRGAWVERFESHRCGVRRRDRHAMRCLADHIDGTFRPRGSVGMS
jgi:small multidrug resistance family-3 protein